MTILFAILLFSFLVFIHELGHFVAAKLSGVQVNEFAVFMGPALVKWQRGETLYSIRCIPFGGYCAMEGEDTDTDNPRSFQKAAWWKRLIILVAGSFMNFVAGFLILVAIYMPAQYLVLPQVDTIEEGSLVGGENGLQVGDRILAVDGEKIYMQSDFSMILSINGGEVHDLLVERSGEKVKGAVLASDAFFPFDDCVTLAAKAGITAIIQPGGSVRDQESIDMCDKYGIAMVFTGIRHFKH